MNWDALWQWLITGGVAAGISLAVAYPKSRGEGRQASGAGQKSIAEAQQIGQTTAVESLQAALAESRTMHTDCQHELTKIQRRLASRDTAIDALIDAVLQIVPLLPAQAHHTEALRAAIRSARASRHPTTPKT